VRICIFCGASSGNDPDFIHSAKNLMRYFKDHEIELVYGGAGIGIMGVLATELINLSGKVIGVIPQQLMKVEIAHGGLDQLHVVKDMHERKKLMYDLSDAFLVLPGGLGTLDELFEIVTWRQLGIHQKPVAILNLNHYFDHLLYFLDHAVSKEFLKSHDRSLIFHSDKWQDVMDYFIKEVK
jgi:uncharacterized protein (TIGR00730 family)